MKKLVEEYQNELIPGFRAKIEELETDNARLRDMWSNAVHNVSIEKSKLKHGYWVYRPYEGDETLWMHHCSICGHPNACKRKYCNECGAIMDSMPINIDAGK
jgi:hypothetical protein